MQFPAASVAQSEAVGGGRLLSPSKGWAGMGRGGCGRRAPTPWRWLGSLRGVPHAGGGGEAFQKPSPARLIMANSFEAPLLRDPRLVSNGLEPGDALCRDAS